MGRKEKKKRARAARPPSQAQNTSAGAGTTTTTLSLKGIISSNDDPYSCHGCGENFNLYAFIENTFARTSTCCGKAFCCTCTAAGKGPPIVIGAACSSCGVSTTRKRSQARAKEGHPWAQFALAMKMRGDGSPLEAKWYRKAAEEGGHPFAFVRLAQLHRHVNPAKVTEFLGEAMEILLSSEFMFDSLVPNCIATMANPHRDHEDRLKFVQHELLVPLANKGLRGAQYQLALLTLFFKEDLSVALELSRKAAVQNDAPRLSPGAPARLAAECCQMLGRIVEGLFWAKQAALAGEWTKKELAEIHSELCEMRKNCSTCGVALDVSNRKLCKGCKISCYCSRDCQKTHWNRPDDGHRDECKTIMKMVEEMEKNAGKTE